MAGTVQTIKKKETHHPKGVLIEVNGKKLGLLALGRLRKRVKEPYSYGIKSKRKARDAILQMRVRCGK